MACTTTPRKQLNIADRTFMMVGPSLLLVPLICFPKSTNTLAKTLLVRMLETSYSRQLLCIIPQIKK